MTIAAERSPERLLLERADELDSRRGAFPEGIVRAIAFETPDRLTEVNSWHGHIPFAFWLVEAQRPRTLVELGTHKGDSYCAFAQAVARLRLPTNCYAVDTWRGDEHAGFYGPDVFEELRHYHDPRYAAFSRLVRSTFDEAASQFSDRSIDLLHIDGMHSYEAVRHDFETWYPKLSSRAVVLFHDIDVRESDFGVWRLWEELTRKFHSFTFRHSHGLGVLVVGRDPSTVVGRLCRYSDAAAEQVRYFFAHLGTAIAIRSRRPRPWPKTKGNSNKRATKQPSTKERWSTRDARRTRSVVCRRGLDNNIPSTRSWKPR